jgi:uncharacterized membrane protein YccC
MSTENRMNPDLRMPVAPPTRSVWRFTVAALLSALAGLLVPKCPLCLAAYLSAAGVGVSFAQGAAPILLRVANGVVATALSWLAARVVLRMWKTRNWRRTRKRPPLQTRADSGRPPSWHDV